MTPRKVAVVGKDQRQRHIEAARKLGTDQSKAIFDRALKKTAKAPRAKFKKSAEPAR